MKHFYEVLAVICAAIGTYMMFMKEYDVVSSFYAMAAYLQSSSNSKDGN